MVKVRSVESIEELTKEINSGKLVILDFWAEWCIPCKIVEEILNRIKIKYPSENVIILRIDAGEYPEIAAEYGVLNLPTVIVFFSGKEIKRFGGSPSGLERKLAKIIDEYAGQ